MRTYLEVTFRRGRPFAAYLYLPRNPADKAAASREVAPGLIADFAADGRVIGLEITSPSSVTVASINDALRAIGQPTVAPADLAPLAA